MKKLKNVLLAAMISAISLTLPSCGSSSDTDSGTGGGTAAGGGTATGGGTTTGGGTGGGSVDSGTGGGTAAIDGGCDAVTVGTAIYTGGSTALQPFVKAVGPKLAAQTSNPYTLFYNTGGSCVGVNNVVDTANNPLVPGGTQFTYYITDTDGGVATRTCLAPAGRTKLDVAISDVFVATCTSAAKPSNIGDFVGPAQSMVFVTHKDSTQTAITAEEAYIALGFGGATQLAPPWVGSDPTKIFFVRNNKSGTQLILSGEIGVPATKWKGLDTGGSGAVYTGLQASTLPEASLGIIGLDYLDQNDTDGTPRRNKLKMLAFASKNQKYAFYPDSTKSSYDKRNLREGRYGGLGFAHLIAPIGTDGQPTDVNVKYLVTLLTGGTVTPAPTFDVAKTIAATAHLVPLCAMKVTRTAEGGDITVAPPAASCSCYFESLVGTAPASCVTCPAGTCASGTCRNGYCEADGVALTTPAGTDCFAGTPTSNLDLRNGCVPGDTEKFLHATTWRGAGTATDGGVALPALP